MRPVYRWSASLTLALLLGIAENYGMPHWTGWTRPVFSLLVLLFFWIVTDPDAFATRQVKVDISGLNDVRLRAVREASKLPPPGAPHFRTFDESGPTSDWEPGLPPIPASWLEKKGDGAEQFRGLHGES